MLKQANKYFSLAQRQGHLFVPRVLCSRSKWKEQLRLLAVIFLVSASCQSGNSSTFIWISFIYLKILISCCLGRCPYSLICFNSVPQLQMFSSPKNIFCSLTPLLPSKIFHHEECVYRKLAAFNQTRKIALPKQLFKGEFCHKSREEKGTWNRTAIINHKDYTGEYLAVCTT